MDLIFETKSDLTSFLDIFIQKKKRFLDFRILMKNKTADLTNKELVQRTKIRPDRILLIDRWLGVTLSLLEPLG